MTGADYRKSSVSVAIFEGGNLPGGAATRYVNQHMQNTDVQCRIRFPFSCVFDRLYISTNIAPGGVATITFTLYVNGAPTALTCVMTGAAVEASDLVNAVAITQGDWISIQCVGSAASAANSRISANLRVRTS